MTPLDVVLDEGPEGGAGRARRVDSMIAGRRKASGAKADAAKDQADAEKPRPARRRRRPRSETKEEKPAEAAKERPSREAKPTKEEARAEPAPTASPAEAAPPAALRRDTPGEAAGELAELRKAVEQQRSLLMEVKAGLLSLGKQVDRTGYRPRLGVFVDVPNLIYGFEGSKPIHMGKLLEFLSEDRQLVRATAYSPVSDDPREPVEQQRFVAPFVPYDYRIVTKALKRFADGSIKGNFDVEMAIDMLSMADRVDVISIVSGDADFARAVEAVQARGVRVEVAAFAGSTSIEMRALADRYVELGAVVDRILG